MPGLNTRTGQRNVASPKQVGGRTPTTNYIPTVKPKDHNPRIIAGSGGQWQQGYLRQEMRAPLASNPYQESAVMGSPQSQALMDQYIAGRRDRRQQQAVAQPQQGQQPGYFDQNQGQGETTLVGFSVKGPQSASTNNPRSQVILGEGGQSALLKSSSARPQGIVRNGSSSTNYGVTNYGTRSVANPTTGKVESRSINSDGTLWGIASRQGQSDPRYRTNQNGDIDGINQPNGDVMPVPVGDGYERFAQGMASNQNALKNDMKDIGSFNLSNQIRMERERANNYKEMHGNPRDAANDLRYSQEQERQRLNNASIRETGAQREAAYQAAEAQKEAARQAAMAQREAARFSAEASRRASRDNMMSAMFNSVAGANSQGWRYW